MKSSILLSLIILTLGGYFGWARSEKITSLKAEVVELTEEAGRLGISTESSIAKGGTVAVRRDVRAERQAIVDEFVAELLGMMKEYKDRKDAEKGSNSPSLELQKRAAEIIKQMVLLNSTELEMMIESLKGYSDLSDEEKQQMAMFSIMMLSSQSPETALDLIVKGEDLLGKEIPSEFLIGAALGGLAKEDPMSALEWIKQNGDKVGGVTQQMKMQLLQGVAGQDLAAAFGMIDELDYESPITGYSVLAQSVKTMDDVDVFLKEVEKVSYEEGERAGVHRVLASGPWMKDFEQAKTFLEGDSLSDETKNELIGGMQAYQLRGREGEWLGWLQEQKELEVQTTSTQLISGWARNDFRAAGEWLNEQEVGPNKQAMVKSYAQTLSEHEPEAAAAWAVTLPEGDERAGLYKKIYGTWMEKDRNAANDFAREHGLEVKEDED